MSHGNLLTASELRELAELEDGIDRHRKGFLIVGENLKKICDKRLYRQYHATFEQYVSKRWPFKVKWAYALMRIFEVNERVCADVDVSEFSARVYYELGRLPERDQLEVARKVVETAKSERRLPRGKDVADIHKLINKAIANLTRVINRPQADDMAKLATITIYRYGVELKSTCGEHKQAEIDGLTFEGLNEAIMVVAKWLGVHEELLA